MAKATREDVLAYLEDANMLEVSELIKACCTTRLMRLLGVL